MRLSTLSLIALCASLALGLLPGIVAQLEILAPGLQVFLQDDPSLYNATTVLHAAALSQALPLTAIALSLGIATERMRLDPVEPAPQAAARARGCIRLISERLHRN